MARRLSSERGLDGGDVAARRVLRAPVERGQVSRPPEAPSPHGVASEISRGLRRSRRVGRVDDHPDVLVADQVPGRPGMPRGDQRQPGGRRLEQDDAERIVEGRKGEGVGLGVELRHVAVIDETRGTARPRGRAPPPAGEAAATRAPIRRRPAGSGGCSAFSTGGREQQPVHTLVGHEAAGGQDRERVAELVVASARDAPKAIHGGGVRRQEDPVRGHARVPGSAPPRACSWRRRPRRRGAGPHARAADGGRGCARTSWCRRCR